MHIYFETRFSTIPVGVENFRNHRGYTKKVINVEAASQISLYCDVKFKFFHLAHKRWYDMYVIGTKKINILFFNIYNIHINTNRIPRVDPSLLKNRLT